MRRIEDEISHNNVLNCDNWNDIQSRTEGECDDIGESEISSHPNVDNNDDDNTNEENNQIGDDC